MISGSERPGWTIRVDRCGPYRPVCPGGSAFGSITDRRGRQNFARAKCRFQLNFDQENQKRFRDLARSGLRMAQGFGSVASQVIFAYISESKFRTKQNDDRLHRGLVKDQE